MAKSNGARANPALRTLTRQWHVYISVFVAPSLLLFALTGALQTFRIPDEKAAPVLIQKLARVHKDEVFALKPGRPKKPDGAGKAADANPAEAKAPEVKKAPRPSTEVLKWFFSMVSVAIAITTLLGLWMALAYSREKLTIWMLLIAGTAAPVLILML